LTRSVSVWRSSTGWPRRWNRGPHLPGLEDQGREEIIAELKTAVEPFRSLYYVKINYVRYLKGLGNFQKSL